MISPLQWRHNECEQIKVNIKAPRRWLVRRSDRWIPRTKGQKRGNVSIWWRHHAKQSWPKHIHVCFPRQQHLSTNKCIGSISKCPIQSLSSKVWNGCKIMVNVFTCDHKNPWKFHVPLWCKYVVCYTDMSRLWTQMNLLRNAIFLENATKNLHQDVIFSIANFCQTLSQNCIRNSVFNKFSSCNLEHIWIYLMGYLKRYITPKLV